MASVTSQLQVGQKVSLTELETGCRLTVVAGDAAGATVVECAPDYVVIEDSAAAVKTRIPAYLIRGVAAAAATAATPVVEAPDPVVEVPAAVEEPTPTPVVEEPVAVVAEAA